MIIDIEEQANREEEQDNLSYVIIEKQRQLKKDRYYQEVE